MLAVAAVLACLTCSSTPAEPPANLRITVWPRGPEASPGRVWTLRCKPHGGTLPGAARACGRLAALPRPFAPVPSDLVCTLIYGGPQVARVTGMFRGRRVWATFRRTDGCQIARWNRVSFLFP